MAEEKTHKTPKPAGIYAALNSILEDIKAISKKGTGYKYKYATLEDILDVVNPLLHKHNLSIHHTVCYDDRGTFLHSTLAHCSGETIESRTPLIYDSQDMKALGATITYARRYAIQCMLNLAFCDGDIDDDQGPNPKASKTSSPRQSTSSAPRLSQSSPLSDEQLATLKNMINEDARVLSELYKAFGIQDLSQLTSIRYAPAVKHVNFLQQKGA